MNSGAKLDLLKYRIEMATYSAMARAMRHNGVLDTALKMLLTKAYGIIVAPQTDPEIFYVVTEYMIKKIAQDLRHTKFKNDQLKGAFIFGAKIGTTPVMAFTEEDARRRFQEQIRQHNTALYG